MKRLILSGEPAGSIPATKKLIEEQWGAKAGDTAGMTELGTVADSAEILDPQLSSYISDAGNHVTISVPRVG